jgi:hypothetical protein
MANPRSAIDVISPAFEQTKRQLFQPFRFGTWARLAVVGIVTGELTGGGWRNTGNFNFPTTTGPEKKLMLLAEPWPGRVLEYLPLILVGVFALICLWLVWIYVASVFRFILFDAVLRARYEIGAGWRNWKEAGGSYFLWQICLSGAALAAFALIVGVPALVAWRRGLLDRPEEHIGTLIGLGVLVFFALLFAVIVAMLIEVLAKDFVVPVMAMENVRVLEGWRKLLLMLGAEKGACAGYVLMKIVLSIGSAILFGILDVVAFLCLLIPLGIAGVALFLLAKAAGFGWNVYTIGAAVILGVVALAAIFFVMGFVYAPGLVFFQSYALRFLGARYAVLEAALAATWGPGAGPEAGPGASAAATPEPSPGSP